MGFTQYDPSPGQHGITGECAVTVLDMGAHYDVFTDDEFAEFRRKASESAARQAGKLVELGMNAWWATEPVSEGFHGPHPAETVTAGPITAQVQVSVEAKLTIVGKGCTPAQFGELRTSFVEKAKAEASAQAERQLDEWRDSLIVEIVFDPLEELLDGEVDRLLGPDAP